MSADERLDELAGSISDGLAVDWPGEETAAEGNSQQASVRALHEVALIAEFNRGLQRMSPGEGGAAAHDAAGGDGAAGPPDRWGELTLLEPIGAGASGEVWRAWDAKLQREVALKFLLPRTDAGRAEAQPAAASLLEEARALARVRHAGVVAVHGIAVHDGRPGMWMEFLRGETLAGAIERRGALPADEVARIGLELCRALEAVDAAGLVHRDLKPANVVLESGGRAVLTDFGLGRRRALLDASALRASGTPIFMSPELLSGEPATPRSDLYALGITLRWALTGRPPFRARSLEQLKAESRGGPDTPLASECPGAPGALVRIIERALAPDAAARYGSASEMAAALQSAIQASRVAAPGGVQVRHRGRVLGIAAALLVAVAGALWLAPRFSGTRPARQAASGAPASAVAGNVRAASPANSSYDVQASLVSRSGGAFRRLAPGDRVAPGDRLSLEFHATRPMWVYVLNEDERGESYLLFPQPLFDRANPLSPESTAVLPGPIGGKENAWTVTSRGGREHFLVVASPAPVPEIESELTRLPLARPGHPVQYAAITPEAVDRLRGVGGVAPLPRGTKSPRNNAFERFRALAGRETGERGIWVRQITLSNPLH